MNDSFDKVKKLADENLEFTRLWVEMLAISIDALSAIALTETESNAKNIALEAIIKLRERLATLRERGGLGQVPASVRAWPGI